MRNHLYLSNLNAAHAIPIIDDGGNRAIDRGS